MPNLALLIAGLIPLAYVAMLIRRYGVSEALSLRVIGVMFLWIGYHLSPWLFFLTGEQWDYFLLVPQHINTALAFSTLSSLLFLIGYSSIFKRRLARMRAERIGFETISVSTLLVAFLACVLLAVVLVSVGGVAELWSATVYRGEGQFEERHGAEKIAQVIAVLRAPLTIAVVLASGFLILGSSYSRLKFWIGHLGLIIASLHGFYFFSRAAGFPLILVAFMGLRMKGRRGLPYALLLISLALFMGSVGLHYRGGYQGVGNYLAAAGDSLARLTEGGGRHVQSSAQFVNPLDSVAPFTKVVELGARPGEDQSILALKFLWNLNPLPSEFVPLFEIGEGLASAMGTWGSTGLTTPALAQMYQVFGYWGSAGMLIVGMLCGWCEKRAVLRPSLLSSLNVLLFFAAFPIGLHSSARAMTRPLVYGAVLILIARFRWKARHGVPRTWSETFR